VRESYSFEAAIEQGAGLLVAAGVTREGTDSRRLEPLLEQARPVVGQSDSRGFTMSSTLHSWSAIPAAMAGVVFRVWCFRQKL
jgi:hypothetical protein